LTENDSNICEKARIDTVYTTMSTTIKICLCDSTLPTTHAMLSKLHIFFPFHFDQNYVVQKFMYEDIRFLLLVQVH